MDNILVLADRQDTFAISVASALRNARQPVRLLTPLEFDAGPAEADSLGAPRAVLNRLHPEAQAPAMMAGWLAALRCPVLGPSSGSRFLRNAAPADWIAAARDAWLPTREDSSGPVTTIRTVYVVAGEVVGAPDQSLVSGLQRLAERSGCNLLECHFGWTATPGHWVFCSATADPAEAPAVLLDAIVAALAGKGRLRQSRHDS